METFLRNPFKISYDEWDSTVNCDTECIIRLRHPRLHDNNHYEYKQQQHNNDSNDNDLSTQHFI